MLNPHKEVIRVTKKDHIPDKPHYAIVQLDSMRYSSGYSGDVNDCEHEFTNYYYTYNEDVWKAKIQQMLSDNISNVWNKRLFFAFRVDKIAKITTKINIE